MGLYIDKFLVSISSGGIINIHETAAFFQLNGIVDEKRSLEKISPKRLTINFTNGGLLLVFASTKTRERRSFGYFAAYVAPIPPPKDWPIRTGFSNPTRETN